MYKLNIPGTYEITRSQPRSVVRWLANFFALEFICGWHCMTNHPAVSALCVCLVVSDHTIRLMLYFKEVSARTRLCWMQMGGNISSTLRTHKPSRFGTFRTKKKECRTGFNVLMDSRSHLWLVRLLLLTVCVQTMDGALLIMSSGVLPLADKKAGRSHFLSRKIRAYDSWYDTKEGGVPGK